MGAVAAHTLPSLQPESKGKKTPRDPDPKILWIFLPNWTAVNKKLKTVSYHNRNVPTFSTIEMSPGYPAGEMAGVRMFCQPRLQG